MASPRTSYRTGGILLLAASLASFAVALYAFLTPLTGVTGTAGALLVVIVSLVIALAALILPVVRSRLWRNVLRVLLLLAVLGTAFAGALLHQVWIPVAMLIGLVGLFIDMSRPARAARTPAEGRF